MSWFVFLIFLTMNGEPTEVQKLTQPFMFYEDCMVFGQIKAGQQNASGVVVVPACIQLSTRSPGSK